MSSEILDPFGGVVISIFISFLLLGAMFVQLYIYFDRYPRNNIWLKVFVIVLFTLDVLNSVLSLMWIYNLLIDNCGNPVAFTKTEWTAVTDPLVEGIMAGMVQGFFAWKIWVLTRNYFYLGVIVLCTLTSLAGSLATSILCFLTAGSADWNGLRYEVGAPIFIWLIPATLGDLVITVIIVIYLQRAKGSIKRTNRILDRITRLTMQNGFLTATVALTDVGLTLGSRPYYLCAGSPISVLFDHPNHYLPGVVYILPKLYTNSALSSLNARQPHIQDIGDEVASMNMPWNNLEGVTVFISAEHESHEMRYPRNPKNVSIARFLPDEQDVPKDRLTQSVQT
ncbi:uncharacterized protein EV420DRAFT_1770216 [Desarmillaria tabescens]|uniref:DUF6534 domain-containing protein n=1 Tax=Armillaria tabescens TaxID=1929756 RepID=A0AA39MJV6_ARMTA|nr:uncharacterized protein EV420DRAFT_1770216 [Desarmillaria tabescens]KAK0436967.1 hypothetical protein EV420DRAFT_1770216 [Desarmillaria tabescens]